MRRFMSMCGVLTALAAGAAVRADDHALSTTQPDTIRGIMFVGGPAHDFEVLPRQLAKQLHRDANIDIRITTDLGELNEAALAGVDVILVNACLDKGLDDSGRKALIGALRQGKGLVAMHCALWCFQDWPEWQKMLGGQVLKHDKFGAYEDRIVYPSHPIAATLPATFTITDEAYYVDQRSPDICVIAQTSETHPGRPGPDPQAWTTRYAGGRVFVTSMGHNEKALFNPSYFKLLVNGIRWSAGRLGPPHLLSDVEREQGFRPLFDGKTLNGWRFDPKLWIVRDGVIVGNTQPKPITVNSCAVADGQYGDFVLRFSVKLVSGNTGVQFRSQELPDFEVAGYQADAVPLGWGNLHEQNGRGRLVDGWSRKAETAVNLKDWNDMEIEARGRHIILRTNGLVTADYVETDKTRPLTGIIALQLHRGEPMEAQFTNIRIKPLDASDRPKQ